jgi:hypothetical protein
VATRRQVSAACFAQAAADASIHRDLSLFSVIQRWKMIKDMDGSIHHLKIFVALGFRPAPTNGVEKAQALGTAVLPEVGSRKQRAGGKTSGQGKGEIEDSEEEQIEKLKVGQKEVRICIALAYFAALLMSRSTEAEFGLLNLTLNRSLASLMWSWRSDVCGCARGCLSSGKGTSFLRRGGSCVFGGSG